ncbi:DHA2 family efflux MFS transporter permease subunit [Asanoa sp. WMMD1127]|uniref:DHA2 family efflux MFS transporter permease subunit n=1 Tax=Asanoa sp. WMMD1127 TaxID=3016107 RepID=UPI0024159AB9|nr:DHA2 family efflux MFS transporter permease subunit [Asanoa sp. WMMD1127]MDG4821438.1 DHA2 family efflux MFS transporter permease subunit [Asanoa sp. WMMD1127]
MPTSRSRWLALGALAIAMLTIGLDTTVLTVAVPTLAVDLDASNAQLQWFASAYTLVLAAVLLPAGSLGDRFGRKRFLLGALVLFGAASVLCAYAGSAETLIAARAALGLGAAIMMPLSMAVLPVLFPDSRERGRALTIWVTSTAIGLPLGPILGGWLLEHFWWGSIFLINVPLVLIGVLAVALFVPESRGNQERPIDLPGIVLSSAGLLGLTYGFIRIGEDSWSDAFDWGLVAAGFALLALFVVRQRRAAYPLIDLALFRSRGFTLGSGLATVINFAMFGLLFLVPQFLQAVGGVSALGTGVRLLPMIGGLLVGTRVGGRVAAKLGSGALIGAGFLLLTLALGLGAQTTADTGYGWTATWIALLGAGMGLAMPATMGAAMDALSVERAGSGSAVIQALRQAGGTIGVAVLGTVLSAGYQSGLGRAAVHRVSDSVAAGVAVAGQRGDLALLDTVRSAFVGGMNQTLWVCMALCALAAVIAFWLLPRRPAAPPPTPPEALPATGPAPVTESLHAG